MKTSYFAIMLLIAACLVGCRNDGLNKLDLVSTHEINEKQKALARQEAVGNVSAAVPSPSLEPSRIPEKPAS